jgi:Flp pilus assembly pilin Flp
MAKDRQLKTGPLAWVQGAMVTLHREEGQTLLEYALLVAFIAIGAVTAMIALAPSIGHAFQAVSGVIEDHMVL